MLIATDKKLDHVTYCSANAGLFFGLPLNRILGRKLRDILDFDLLHELNNTMSLSSARVQRERVTDHTVDNKKFEVWAHLSHGVPIIEFELAGHLAIPDNKTILEVRSLLARVSYNSDLDSALQEAAIGLRSLTDFDRVLVYQFDSTGDGEVIAEARGPHLESFLGLRFPSWDIPAQARAIMKTLPLRVIADVKSEPVAIHSLEDISIPLDLTLASSRGVSPIHLEYLSNMGIAGSMTLSVVVNGDLWGLFAFHHSKPRNIGPNLRGAAELFIQFFSLQMEQRLAGHRNQARARILKFQSALLGKVTPAGSLIKLTEKLFEPFCEFLQADGLAIITEDDFAQYGLTPNETEIRNISGHLLSNRDDTLAVSDTLTSMGFESQPLAGALAITLDDEGSCTAIFFRKEAALSVKWAGAPEKEIVEDDQGIRLVPRGSFKAYSQGIKGKSLPWEQDHLFLAQEIQKALTQANSVLFRRLTHKSERQQSLYIAELNHRVRNILSLIRSLSRRTRATSQSLESYAKALESRIAALGAAHDLATNQITNGIVINDIFKLEIKPFEMEDKTLLKLSGASYVMRADVALIFALIVHELTTNSVKHGALSNLNGFIEIHIESANGGINIIWQEKGGPATFKPSKNGFGMDLIENAVPYELNGESQIEFRPEGFYAKFFLPDEFVDPLKPPLDGRKSNTTPKAIPNDQLPRHVLILEDHMMLALDLADTLSQIGVKDIKKCANVSSAKRLLENYEPNFALLDINLKDSQSFEVADALMRKEIPFCFATGYGSNYPIPKRFAKYKVLTKPIETKQLKQILEENYNSRSIK